MILNPGRSSKLNIRAACGPSQAGCPPRRGRRRPGRPGRALASLALARASDGRTPIGPYSGPSSPVAQRGPSLPGAPAAAGPHPSQRRLPAAAAAASATSAAAAAAAEPSLRCRRPRDRDFTTRSASRKPAATPPPPPPHPSSPHARLPRSARQEPAPPDPADDAPGPDPDGRRPPRAPGGAEGPSEGDAPGCSVCVSGGDGPSALQLGARPRRWARGAVGPLPTAPQRRAAVRRLPGGNRFRRNAEPEATIDAPFNLKES